MEDTPATFCSCSELLLGSAVSGSRRIRRSRNASHAGECIITHSQTTPSARSLACSSGYKSARIRDGALRLRPFSYLCKAHVSREECKCRARGYRYSYPMFPSNLNICIKCIEGEKARMFEIFKHFSKFSANSKKLKYAWLISFYRRIIIRKKNI